MVSSKDSHQSAQRTGMDSAGSPAHPAGRTALLALARLLARQAAREAVRSLRGSSVVQTPRKP